MPYLYNASIYIFYTISLYLVDILVLLLRKLIAVQPTMSNNDKRATQMFISRQELLGKGARQLINRSLPTIDEGIPQNLKRVKQHNNRFTKIARTNTKQPEEIFKGLFSSDQGEPYKDQYKGNITLLDLGGEVNIVRKKGSSEYFTARRLYKDNADNILTQLNEMRHESLIAAIEVFTEGDNVYIVADKMLLSLTQIVKSPPFPSAEEIGIIMGQVWRFPTTVTTINEYGTN